MSIPDLKAALAANPGTRLAVVSQPLFINLLSAGELIQRIAALHLPRDPRYGETVDALIRSMGHNPDTPVPIPYYTLTKHPDVLVHLADQHGLSLSASGPGSLRLF